MLVYSVIKEFCLHLLNQTVEVGDTVGKLESRVGSVVDGTEWDDQAFFDWVGSVNSLEFLQFVGTVPDPPVPGAITESHGTEALLAGQDFFTLTGAAFGFVPTALAVIVVKPSASGDNLFATLRDGTLTADGFTVDLQSNVPGAGYKLSYFVIE
jgi:hypothetical protein